MCRVTSQWQYFHFQNILFFDEWMKRVMTTRIPRFTAVYGYYFFVLSISSSRIKPLSTHAFKRQQCYVGPMVARRLHQRTQGLYSTTTDDAPEPMENLYQSWSVEQDRYLFDHRKEPLPTLAAMTGRGLRGVEARLAKLKDTNNAAYLRLFAGQEQMNTMDKETKLVPANEILRRIQWDQALCETDFSVLYYDRVDDTIMESRMDAPNKSVAGKETKLVLAIPEHRIVGIKYKEQVIWDRDQRIDKVFGSMNGRGETIAQVIANYNDWKLRHDAAEELNRLRHIGVSNRIQQALGEERFLTLKKLSNNLRNDLQLPTKKEIETYVNNALQLFRDARGDFHTHPSFVPSTDLAALDAFSELVVFLPDSNLRPSILTEISTAMKRVEGKNKITYCEELLPDLDEEDLTESFVRGSGAGGQKVNKTSNKVVLLHKPTQLRVECQDTRSLQQNRKIARKRLRMKLDEYLNGNQSKVAIKAITVSSKKAKAKTRNKSRQRKKKGDSGQFSDDDGSDDDDNDDDDTNA